MTELRMLFTSTHLRETVEIFREFFSIVFQACKWLVHRLSRPIFWTGLILVSVYFIWLIFVDHREKLTGVYCHSSIPISRPDTRRCSFEQIDACQRIDNRSLLYIIQSELGFVSELNNLLNAFAYSIFTQRRFLVDGEQWNYGAFHLYFDIEATGLSPLVSMEICLNRTFVSLAKDHSLNERVDHLMVSRQGTASFRTLNALGRTFREVHRNDYLSVERKRQVGQYLWQHLSTRARQAIQSHKEQLVQFNLSSNSFDAMHIRRGDKLRHESPRLLTTADYADAIDSISTNRTVFIASDSQQTVVEQLAKVRPHWQLIYLKYKAEEKQSAPSPIQMRPRNRTGHFQYFFNRLSPDRKIYMTDMFLTEILILSEARSIVCTFSSNICRFVQLLRTQNLSTIRSLDIDWYPE